MNGRADYQLSATSELSGQFGWTEGVWHAGRLLEPLEPPEQDVSAQYVQFKFRRSLGSEHEWTVQFYHTRNRIDASSFAELCLDPGLPHYQSCSAGLPTPPYFPTGLFIDGSNDLRHQRTNLEFAASNRLSDMVRMAWGLEARQDTVESWRYFHRADALSGSLARVYANAEWRLAPEWLVQGGAMLEHHHYVGADVSPRVAVNYELAGGHTLRAGVSQAYRTPTFFEQEGDLAYYSTTGVELARLVSPAAKLTVPLGSAPPKSAAPAGLAPVPATA